MHTLTQEITVIDGKIGDIEGEIVELKKKLAEIRKQRPREEVQNYTFKTPSGEVTLSDLFQGKDDLILIHNMGQSCRHCTLWADGFTGLAQHLQDRAGFVLTSPDSPEAQKKFAESRNWNFPIASAEGTTFPKDMGFEPEPGEFWPGVSAFYKDPDGRIYRTGKASFGGGDDFCAVWPMLDLLQDGSNGWVPQYRYNV